jgi:hypothetical protein
MRSLALFVVPLVLSATGCKKYTLVEQLDGDWAGTATAADVLLPTTASFVWDDEEEAFTGTVDFDGYYYLVNGAASDKEYAEMGLYPDVGQGPGEINTIELNEEGDEFDSKFKINICANGEGDPAACELVGTLNMKMQ